MEPTLFETVHSSLDRELQDFVWRGSRTRVDAAPVRYDDGRALSVPTYTNEFWTSRQRAAHSLHEVSYRACFKPQLPRFFIERLTRPGGVVYDPFMGRGTTLIEAALLGRTPVGCDVNPLSRILVGPRLTPPPLSDVLRTLTQVNCDAAEEHGEEERPDLLAFYHPETLSAVCSLRGYLLARDRLGQLSDTDAWIRMVAVNRLTGHSPGFFSGYTLPPNQAVSVASQRRINERRGLTPPRRDVAAIIARKSRHLLRDCDEMARRRMAEAGARSMLVTGDAACTPAIPSDSVDLVVTSPPFLDVVDYATDNWLRCWFCGIETAAVGITVLKRLDVWQAFVADVLRELRRVLRRGGHVAFEVGEVRGGAVKLEHAVLAAGASVGLQPILVLVNSQQFTKTANCWGVSNNAKGTNSNRVVLFEKT